MLPRAKTESRSPVDLSLNLDHELDMVERDLTLLGCTAVEDRLQREVPESIRDFLKAGKSRG